MDGMAVLAEDLFVATHRPEIKSLKAKLRRPIRPAFSTSATTPGEAEEDADKSEDVLKNKSD